MEIEDLTEPATYLPELHQTEPNYSVQEIDSLDVINPKHK
jgi:hypothetical protein